MGRPWWSAGGIPGRGALSGGQRCGCIGWPYATTEARAMRNRRRCKCTHVLASTSGECHEQEGMRD
eukprot:1423431-Amphidinium_carterae.1